MDNKKIVVFASGSGTNFINLYNNISNGRVVLLVSNNSMCGAIQYAADNNSNIKKHLLFLHIFNRLSLYFDFILVIIFY